MSCTKIVMSFRDGVTFLKVRGPILWTPDQTWGGPNHTYTIVKPKSWGGLGPPGPLDDYIPVTFFRFHKINHFFFIK